MSTETAPVAWFEFLLNPSLLEEHVKGNNPVPSPIDLIIQFIFNGMKRNENIINEGEIMDVTTQKVTDKMKHVLTVMPLQVAAHLKWDLELFEQKLPLHILDSLLVALLHETLEEFCNPATHATLDTGPLLPHQLFGVALYHRYALAALVKAKLPSKPPKVSNVPIPGQQDLMHESREVHDGIISVLERGADVSISILEQLLTAGEVRTPVLQSFSTTQKSNPTESPHLWNRCILVPDEQFKYQIHYDLGNYHFLHERFSDALHHLTEAFQLLPEVGSAPQFCRLREEKLMGFYRSCSAICGRSTPVEKRALYDRFMHSRDNNFEGLLEILCEDNLRPEIPSYLRQSLQLDLLTKHQNLPEGLLFHVQTMNTVGDVLEGRCWDNMYPISLLQAGKEGALYLVQLLGSKLTQYTAVQKERVRVFVKTLAVSETAAEQRGGEALLVSQVMACAPLASLFQHEEIVALWPGPAAGSGPEGGKGAKGDKGHKRAFDASLGSDHTNPNDLTWDLIHCYDSHRLDKTFKSYLASPPLRPGGHKKDVLDLNAKWEGLIPIPVRNTLMKLMPEPHKGLVLLYIAKAQELSLAKSFPLSLSLLNEASALVRTTLPSKDHSRPCKMIKWMALAAKIQQQIHDLPCVEESEVRALTAESKQCLSALSSSRDMVPWSNIINWCILLLLNAQDWSSLLGGAAPLPSHFPIMHLVKPLAATAQALHAKLTTKKPWTELFDIVSDIVVGNSSYREQPVMSRPALLDLLESIKEPLCLSLLVSLLGHLLNIKTSDPSSAIHIDHTPMWPSKYSGLDHMGTGFLKEILNSVVDHSTKLYSLGAHTNTSLCASWFLTKADLAHQGGAHRKALQSYLTAIFVATNYLRNDVVKGGGGPGGIADPCNAMSDLVLKRMISCCRALNNYTQAAILCQFLESIDYTKALGCLQERNAVDGMDAYYDCLFDVTLMEFVINLHQKKGENGRRDKVMKLIGLLEINANNNDEIQREAAKVRKHRFLRAMAKQYL